MNLLSALILAATVALATAGRKHDRSSHDTHDYGECASASTTFEDLRIPGAIFAVEPLKNITITKFTVHTLLAGKGSVRVWMKEGNYGDDLASGGNGLDVLDWTLIQNTKNAKLKGYGVPSELKKLKRPIRVNAGDVVSFHIVSELGIVSTENAVSDGTYSNDDALEIGVGRGCDGVLDCPDSLADRIWNGVIDYCEVEEEESGGSGTSHGSGGSMSGDYGDGSTSRGSGGSRSGDGDDGGDSDPGTMSPTGVPTIKPIVSPTPPPTKIPSMAPTTAAPVTLDIEGDPNVVGDGGLPNTLYDFILRATNIPRGVSEVRFEWAPGAGAGGSVVASVDGTGFAIATVTTEYATPGTYTFAASVYDGQQLLSDNSVQVKIAGVTLNIDPSVLNDVVAGDVNTLDFIADGIPSSIGNVKFTWSFGVGSAGAGASGNVPVTSGLSSWSASHTYTTDGSYGFVVDVRDAVTGNVLASNSMIITVGTIVERDNELNICTSVWSVAKSGLTGVTVDNWDIEVVPDGAIYDLKFEAFGIPDKFIVEYPIGNVVLDTGWPIPLEVD